MVWDAANFFLQLFVDGVLGRIIFSGAYTWTTVIFKCRACKRTVNIRSDTGFKVTKVLFASIAQCQRRAHGLNCGRNNSLIVTDDYTAACPSNFTNAKHVHLVFVKFVEKLQKLAGLVQGTRVPCCNFRDIFCVKDRASHLASDAPPKGLCSSTVSNSVVSSAFRCLSTFRFTSRFSVERLFYGVGLSTPRPTLLLYPCLGPALA